MVTSNKTLIEFIVPSDNCVDDDLGIFHFRYSSFPFKQVPSFGLLLCSKLWAWLRFWVRGNWLDVVVDDRIPYYDCWGDGKPIPALLKVVDGEIWPAMIEKAFAKLNGSYFNIERGSIYDALENFTGG